MADYDYAVPAGLEDLVRRQTSQQHAVTYRPSTWERKLEALVPPQVLAVLRDNDSSCPVSSSPDARGATSDRSINRHAVHRRCANVLLESHESVLAAWLLVQVWGSGLTGNRSLRYTHDALTADRIDATYEQLRRSVEVLRAADETDLGALAATHRNWRVRGIGQSFASKWWAFAGEREGRSWQPLILDRRVYATLNNTFDITTTGLARSRQRAERYQAYVEAMHSWAPQLSGPGVEVKASRLEWVMFQHNGAALRPGDVR